MTSAQESERPAEPCGVRSPPIVIAGWLLIVAALVLSTVAWLRLDNAPPLWDSAYYLQQSAILYRAWDHGGIIAFFDAFSASMDRKAPLIAALPIPFYEAFGESYLSARYVNVAWIVLCSWFLFRLGRSLSGDGVALLSVVILHTFPLVAGMSRQFLVEYGLMTIVVIWMYYLMRWRRGESGAAPWILGLLLGTGLLLKVTLPLYLAAPTWIVARSRRAEGHSYRSILLDLARIGAVALPIALTWYGRNLGSVMSFVLDAGFGKAGSAYGTGPVLAPGSIGAYWRTLVNSGISAYWMLVALIVLIATFVLSRRGVNRAPILPRQDLPWMLAWWLVPFFALSFVTNKDPRYTVPYLPALALLLAAALAQLVPLGKRKAGLAAIATLGALNYSAYSFGVPATGGAHRAGGLVLLADRLGWAYPPSAEVWPDEEVVNAVAEDAARLGKRQAKVRVLFSHPSVNAHVLNYLAALHDKEPRFTTVHFQNPDSLSVLVAGINSGYDYLLTKSGSLGPDPVNARNREAVAALERKELHFEKVAVVAMPDASEVTVLRRTE